MNDDEFIPTRRSLLSRLKNWQDEASWKAIFGTYSRSWFRVPYLASHFLGRLRA